MIPVSACPRTSVTCPAITPCGTRTTRTLPAAPGPTSVCCCGRARYSHSVMYPGLRTPIAYLPAGTPSNENCPLPSVITASRFALNSVIPSARLRSTGTFTSTSALGTGSPVTVFTTTPETRYTAAFCSCCAHNQTPLSTNRPKTRHICDEDRRSYSVLDVTHQPL